MSQHFKDKVRMTKKSVICDPQFRTNNPGHPGKMSIVGDPSKSGPEPLRLGGV